MRHSSVYTCGIVVLTPTRVPPQIRQPRHEVGEAKQVHNAETRTSPAEHELRVGRDVVRPVHRERADAIRVDPQQEPRTVAVAPLTNARELLAAQRVERMRDAHKARHRERRACILS
jgi:hypothetical protein